MAVNDLTDLRSRVRSLAEMENSPFVDDVVDLLPFINAGWNRLYNELVQVYETFNRQQYDVTLVADQEVYDLSAVDPLPFKLLGADLSVSGRFVPLQTFEWNDRGSVPPGPNTFAGQTMRIYYIPTPYPFADKLTDGAIDNTNGTSPAGTIYTLPNYVQPAWAEFIVLEAALRCATREEGIAGNIGPLSMLRDDKLAEIRSSAPRRNAGSAPRATRRADRMRGYDPFGPLPRLQPWGRAPSLRYMFDSMTVRVLGGIWP